jgi:hypothetical protein
MGHRKDTSVFLFENFKERRNHLMQITDINTIREKNLNSILTDPVCGPPALQSHFIL